MTEKKQGVPVQEPVPAEEPAKAGDNNKIWHYNGKFPVVVDYLVFFGIFLLAQGLGTAVAWLAGCKWPDPELLASPDEAISTAEQIAAGHFNAMTYFVSMSVTLAGFLFYRRRRHGPTVVARFSRRGLNPVLLLWGVFFMLSTSVVLEPLLSLMPEVPNVYGRGAWAIVTVVVMAPLFEEVIFRGVLLESTRVRYGVVAAWLLSSAIFGIVHVHPTVVVNAFVMGLVLAFIYLRTDSLWSAIILHAINNGIAYLALIAGHGNSMLIDMVGSRTLYVLIYIAALALSVCVTLLVSRLLSATLLRGESSAFSLELPPYRRPRVGQVLVRSLLDRTVFVLGRAVTVAAPAGLLIYLLGNCTVGDTTLLAHGAAALDPLGRALGLDGMILLAFLLGFPANEIVLPILLMGYSSAGTLVDGASLAELKTMLLANGWTGTTALCMLLFSLFHFPCGTTTLTLARESKSLKWTLLGVALPTAVGMTVCFAVHLAATWLKI